MHSHSRREPEERYPHFEPLPEVVERVVDTIGKRTGHPEISTGFEVIDQGIYGLHAGQLLTVAARPGQGKTSFACQVAYNVAKQGILTAFLSLEMTAETILERMFCSEYNVKAWDLLRGSVSPEIKKKLVDFMTEAHTLQLRIIDDYCFTENELFTLFDHLEYRPKVLILDHIQHIRSSSKKSNYECLTEYFRYLKELAMRHGIAVVVLSQINRSGEENPTLANLKGSGGIEEMSDYVFLMSPHKDLCINEYGKNFSIMVAKNRFGPPGIKDMYFNPEKTRFQERDTEYLSHMK